MDVYHLLKMIKYDLTHPVNFIYSVKSGYDIDHWLDVKISVKTYKAVKS